MSKPRKAGGSRTAWDVLRHPIDVLGDPTGSSHAKAQSDLAASASGETMEVSCWLRGSQSGLPQKFTQGIFLIGPDGMSWHHWFRYKDRLIPIPPLDRIFGSDTSSEPHQRSEAKTGSVYKRRHLRPLGMRRVRRARRRTSIGSTGRRTIRQVTSPYLLPQYIDTCLRDPPLDRWSLIILGVLVGSV
jgi:hypothetical protein